MNGPAGFYKQPFYVRWAARIVAKAILKSAIHSYETGWMAGEPVMTRSASLAQIIRRVFAGDEVNTIDMEREREKLIGSPTPPQDGG